MGHQFDLAGERSAVTGNRLLMGHQFDEAVQHSLVSGDIAGNR